jgi:ESF2/ABP1 family protein
VQRQGFGPDASVRVTTDVATTRKRRKRGGNRGKRYVEGWVEFARKKDAKTVARELNNQTIGARRRRRCHGSRVLS